MSKDRKIIDGRILSFDTSPLNKDFDFLSLKVDKKRIFVTDGIIESIESVNITKPEFEDIEVVDYGDHLISAGFVDAHVHYPQTAIIASWGKRLIDWLNIYTFPEEMRFKNLQYASESLTGISNFLYRTVLQQWQVIVQFIQKVLMLFLNLQLLKICV